MDTRFMWVAGILAVALAACFGTRSPKETGPPGEDYTLQHDGRERQYRLQVPDGVEGPAPLVITLHGGFGDGEQVEGHSGFNRLGEEHGFVTAYPYGVDNHWNDGRTGLDYEAHTDNVDDVGFILAMIDDIDRRVDLDRDRIFVDGISNGGMMAYRLACDAAGTLAAVASVVGSMPADYESQCEPGQPVPVLSIMGTDDPLMPYEGGQIGTERRQLGEVLSTDEVLAFWRQNNGCANEVSTTSAIDAVEDDDTSVQIQRWSQGCAGAPVVHYRIDGGGHAWPGEPRDRKLLGGIVSKEFRAEEVIWEFFAGLE